MKFLILATLALAATPQMMDSYLPRPVDPPKNGGYVLRDGSISIVGYNDMREIFASLNAIFVRSHPGLKFKMQLNGTATAAPSLMFGVSAFAPMGAEFSSMELAAYRSFVGADPMPIRVAHCSLNPYALSAPVGIFVNQQNPIQKLTVEQVARIFSTGSLGGDITNWGQIGLKDDWAARSIHPCGIAEEAAAGLAAFIQKRMGGRSFTPEYESFTQSAQVIQRVGEDPAAIGFASANLVAPQTRLVAIAAREGGDYESPNASSVMSGSYPYDRYLLIYIRRIPGQPIDPFVKEYLRLVLSKEGQQAIAAAPPNYLPLNSREIGEELAKLDR
jgi:phosphate transport system substrate-binding protein